jgi:hypothetical protein
MSKIRLAVIATPRSGNTWLRMLLGRFYNIPTVAVHELTEAVWAGLPEEVVLQIHWRREPEFMARLEREGFRVVTLARHPLDVLISILHVVVYDVESEGWLLSDQGNERSIWAATPRSRTFIDYCRSSRAHALLGVTCDHWGQPGVLSLKYEDLVADPPAVLAAVEDAVGPRRVADLEPILNDLSIGNLRKTTLNNHFWKGKPGLWRELIPAAEAAEIADGLRPVLDRLGYAVDPDPATDAGSADRAWNRYAGEEMGRTIRRNADEYRKQITAVQEAVNRLSADNRTLLGHADMQDGRIRELHDQERVLTGKCEAFLQTQAAHVERLCRQEAALAEAGREVLDARREADRWRAASEAMRSEAERSDAARRRAEDVAAGLTAEVQRFRRLQGFSLRLAERSQRWRDRLPWLFRPAKAVAALLRGRAARA